MFIIFIIIIRTQIHAQKSIVVNTHHAESRELKHFVFAMKDGPIIQRKFQRVVSVRISVIIYLIVPPIYIII